MTYGETLLLMCTYFKLLLNFCYNYIFIIDVKNTKEVDRYIF